MAEAGMPGVSFSSWSAVFGPAKMPKEIAERLSRELNVVLQQPDVRMQFERQAFQGEGPTPQALAAYVKEEFEKWKLVVREYGITQE